MKGSIDWPLILLAIGITMLGAMVHYSLSPETILTHLAYIAVGLIVALGVMMFDFRIIRYFHVHMYILMNVLLVLTLVLGRAIRGSVRWIEIGSFQFQPSELAKIFLILSLPSFLVAAAPTQVRNLLIHLGLIGLPTALIFIQPDLGSAMMISGICAAMLFASGIRFRYIVLLLTVGIIISPIGWLFLKDYQRNRVLTFIDPTADPLGKGYNSIQSLVAVGSGQIIGRGLGHGTQSKLKFLPEYKTDFVFASLSEELGFVGSIGLLVAYFFLLMRLLTLAQRAPDHYSYLAIIGVAAMFAAQIVINTGMNIAILPVTGVTLPLVSSGGTSLVVSLFSLALAMKLSTRRNNQPDIEISLR